MNAIFLKAWTKCAAAGELPRRVLRRLAGDERAVSVIEYAILLGVIVAATAVAVNQFGDEIGTAINTIAGNVQNTVSTVGNT